MPDILEDEEKITREEAKAAKADTMPAGWYTGVLVNKEVVDTETEGYQGKPTFGQRVYNLRVDLSLPDGRTRPFFFHAMPKQVKGDKGLLPQSRAAAQLVEATEMYDQPFSAVYDAAASTKLFYKITLTEESEKGDARNWLGKIQKDEPKKKV